MKLSSFVCAASLVMELSRHALAGVRKDGRRPSQSLFKLGITPGILVQLNKKQTEANDQVLDGKHWIRLSNRKTGKNELTVQDLYRENFQKRFQNTRPQSNHFLRAHGKFNTDTPSTDHPGNQWEPWKRQECLLPQGTCKLRFLASEKKRAFTEDSMAYKYSCDTIRSRSCRTPRDCDGCLGLFTCKIPQAKCDLKGVSRTTALFYENLPKSSKANMDAN